MNPNKRLSFSLIGIGLFLIAATLVALVGLPGGVFAAPAPSSEASGAAAAPLFLPFVAGSPPGFLDHAGKTLTYNGAATCQECHAQQVHDFGASNHYLWQGKLGAMNDFCGYPDVNLGPARLTTTFGTKVDGGCLACHAGLGEKPTAANPQNADCLICHASQYKRIAVDTGGGVFRFRPNTPAMPAAITIQREPAREACLKCHAASGGGENNKRGDMSLALVNPTPDQDVHMGGGMTCVDCHTSSEHKIAGRGVDLLIDEGTPMRACTECHTPQNDHGSELRRHLAKVACQTCHIPAFARSVSTDMLRDYHSAEVNPRGLYEPVIRRGANVIPEYAFWNGQSGFYSYKSPALSGQLMAFPQGGIDDGKLYPFKLHQAWMPQDPVSKAILPVKAGILFQSGDMNAAIIAGATQAGFDLSQGYTFVDVQRWMGIFHEMPPADQALLCADCHEASDRIDFPALGYSPRASREGKPLCSSCHSAETPPNFYELHQEHAGEAVACSECHTFSR